VTVWIYVDTAKLVGDRDHLNTPWLNSRLKLPLVANRLKHLGTPTCIRTRSCSNCFDV
jgi:hypothetical protein